MGAIEGSAALRAADGGGLELSLNDGISWGHVSGTLAVANETALAAVNVAHMPLGTLAYVIADAAYFQLLLSGSNLIWQQVPLGGGGSTRSATTVTPVTSLSIVVSADGDGEYLVEFEGTILASGGPVTFKLQANGADLPSALGNYVLFSASAASVTGTNAQVVCIGQSFMTNNHMTVLGSFSWRASSRSGWASQFASHSDGGDFSGITSGTYVAGAAALSTLALTASVASGIVSGTFMVRKVA